MRTKNQKNNKNKRKAEEKNQKIKINRCRTKSNTTNLFLLP